jgi:SAM-dependent methyltransferase
VSVSIGHKLGLYKAMAGAGPLSSAEVASRAGCAERYVREWLNAQAAGGSVAYHPSSATYELTSEQAMIFADETSPYFLPNNWQVVASVWADEHKAVRAIRTGEGVSWGDHDERLYCGVAAFYRNAYSANLVSAWLPALDGVVDRLEQGAKVADIGCGHGHSAILMAQAFPKSRFWGFDTHEESIVEARELAAKAGVADRVTFEIAGAASYPARSYDLVCFFDCLHDLGRPVEAARHAREALARDGVLMLIEPFAADRVEENLNPISRLYYIGSTVLCCAHAISENGTHVLGAQAGEKQLRDVLGEAGFSDIRCATKTPFNLVLEARA